MLKYFITLFSVAFGISFLLTPLLRRLSIKMNWVDKPNWRKINKKPMPLLGGLAIYCGFVASLLLFSFKGPFTANTYKLLGLLGGSFIIILIGIEDDIKGLTPRRKLFYQIMAALIAYLYGFTILKVTHPLGGSFYLPVIAGMLLTLFWIVGFTNAINLLDGLDGLAAGVVAIIAGSLFFSGIRSANLTVAILSLVLSASALGFLPYNFYPARIFMGDTGAMFLGFTLALISIEGTNKGSIFVTLSLPIIAMGVPVIDTFISIVRRLIKGNGVFQADKEHMHHKLLFSEGSQREAVVTLYFLTACFGLIAIALSRMSEVWAFIAIIITAIITLRWLINFNIIEFHRRIKSKWRNK